MKSSCWTKLSSEARDLVKDSILAKSIVAFIPLALGIMMYFPVKCIIQDQRSIDCIVIASVLGLAIIGILLLVISVYSTKPAKLTEQSNSAKSPKMDNDTDFIASNPIHTQNT